MAQALPAQAASFPTPMGASPSKGQGPEEDYTDSLMDIIGSQPEELQGEIHDEYHGGVRAPTLRARRPEVQSGGSSVGPQGCPAIPVITSQAMSSLGWAPVICSPKGRHCLESLRMNLVHADPERWEQLCHSWPSAEGMPVV